MNKKLNLITILALVLLALALAGRSNVEASRLVLAQEPARATVDDDDAWSALGAGVDGEVRAIAISGNYVYVGGMFNSAGNCTTGCNNIARWNIATQTWSALGTGVDGQVLAIAVDGNSVYVGGSFGEAGGMPASRIAVWNESAGWWSSLGAMNDSVYAIAIRGDELYAGGAFTSAGGCTGADLGCWFIANRDVYGWEPLWTGTNSYVYAIAAGGTGVYVGGDFTSASGLQDTAGIAYWDGTSWDPLDHGRESGVRAIAVSGSDVYVPGVLYSGGGVPETTLSKWNSSSGWSDLSPGLGDNNAIYALAANGNDVYAGGAFQDNDNGAPNHIARWNSDNGWSALGQGTDGTVYAIAVSGDYLYVGGTFSHAGGKEASNIARYHLSADLSVGVTDGKGYAIPGEHITYTLSVTNAGPDATIGALVTDTFPETFTEVWWTCVAAGGSCSAPSGNGNLSTLVNLNVGGVITFTIHGRLSPSATGSLVNTAQVSHPADSNLANNSAMDSDIVLYKKVYLPLTLR